MADVMRPAQASAESHFSWLRSKLSSDRTLMSYARSSMSFIGVGFTIYEYLAEHGDAKAVVLGRGVSAPQWLGLGLMVAGVVLLIAGTNDYREFLGSLKDRGYGEISGITGWRLRAGVQLMVTLLFVAAAFAFIIVLFNPSF
jgi:putative membrane protein